MESVLAFDCVTLFFEAKYLIFRFFMLQNISQFIFFRLMGWKVDVTVEIPKKCIFSIAPHTSNWDFLVGQLYALTQGVTAGFLMKKEWFFWPLGPLFRSLGGIPVYRQKNCSLTDVLADTARESETFRLAITPEGTRSLVDTWKRGFYYIAQKSGIPILLFAIDAQNRTVVCHRMFEPTGDVEADMREIMEYYRPYIHRGFKPHLSKIEEMN